jgi:hypothetical protein
MRRGALFSIRAKLFVRQKVNSKFNIVMLLLLCMSCNSSSNINEKPVKQEPSEVANNTVKVAPTHPYMMDGLSTEMADREFHKNDCTGYREFYNIAESVLPCDDDYSVYYESSETYLAEIYLGYRGEDEENSNKRYYRNKVSVDIDFFSEHDGSLDLSIYGVDTHGVVATSSPSIFKWNYKARNWSQTPEPFTFLFSSVEIFYSVENPELTESTIECSDYTITSLIAKEEVFRIKATVWKADTIVHGGIIREDKISLVIPTPSLRRDMFKAYLSVKK